VRSNLIGPFVASLLSRSQRSQRWAADVAGVGHTSLSERLRGVKSSLGVEALVTIAEALGATADEVQAVRDLDAIDRGALPLDEATTADEVRAAREAIEACR
jgi:transcriptional regulator with XRE-family HTH domain